MQSTSDQQNNVVNHVAVCNEIQESRHGLYRVVPEVLELDHELFTQLIINSRYGQGAGLVCQECSIVCALKVKF